MGYSIRPLKRKNVEGIVDKGKVVPLVIYFRIDSKQGQVNSKIKARYRDFVKGKDGTYHIKSSCRNSTLINKEIQRIKYELDKIETFENILSIGDYQRKTKSILENESEDMIGKDNSTISVAANKYFLRNKNKNTLKSEKYKLGLFLKFAKNENISDLREIEKEIFVSYREYLVSKGYRNTTSNKFLDVLKTFLRWCMKENNLKIDKKVLGISNGLPEGTGLTIKLEEEEIEKLENTILESKLDRVRDIALFQMYTGQRYGDISNYNPDQIIDGVWTLVQQKTKKQVSLRLHYKILTILEKYNYKIPILSSQKFNIYIKELFKKLKIDRVVLDCCFIGQESIIDSYKLYEKISSHDFRHTFICESLRRGVPVNDVMYWSGHTDLKSFQVYITSTGNASSNSIDRAWTKCNSHSTPRNAFRGNIRTDWAM